VLVSTGQGMEHAAEARALEVQVVADLQAAVDMILE